MRPPIDAVALLLLVLVVALSACQAPRPRPLHLGSEIVMPPPPGEDVVVCGQRFAIGVPVVLWTEPPHYDAASTEPRFGPADTPDAPSGLRYRRGRAIQRADGTRTSLVEPDSKDLGALRRTVDQVVLHYDVCGTSATCFRVLHDQRGLSVHFLLDIDGTIYQTLDLRDQASHATKANPRSIGIEIANVGAYPPGRRSLLDEWYAHDAGGPYLAVPERLHGGGVRTRGFVGRPARLERIRGRIQDHTVEMYDLTREQYEALAALAAGLCRIFPRIEPDAPRDERGEVRTSALSDAEFDAFRGILGHCHVQSNKLDPGPAFDWEAFLARVRERLGTKPE